ARAGRGSGFPRPLMRHAGRARLGPRPRVADAGIGRLGRHGAAHRVRGLDGRVGRGPADAVERRAADGSAADPVAVARLALKGLVRLKPDTTTAASVV